MNGGMMKMVDGMRGMDGMKDGKLGVVHQIPHGFVWCRLQSNLHHFKRRDPFWPILGLSPKGESTVGKKKPPFEAETMYSRAKQRQ